MNDYGTHEVTDEFKDEDKWVFLTKRQWAIVLPAALISIGGVALVVVTNLMVFLPVIITLALISIAVALIVAFCPMPDNWYLYGGGMNLERVLFRLIKKKVLRKHKTLYTKHYNNGSAVGVGKSVRRMAF